MNPIRYRFALAVVACAALARCGGETAPGAPAPAPPAPVAATPASVTEAAEAPATPAREPIPEPGWPAHWKEVRRGNAGPAALPLFWFELEAGPIPPEQAVREALDALRPLAGRLAFEDVAVARAEPRAIAQFRGGRLSGVIEARSGRTGTEIHVTLESPP